MSITGPRVVAFWGSLLAILLILCAVGHEQWVDLSLWGFSVTVVYSVAALAVVASKRAPVHRGSFAWPVSASPAIAFAAACGMTAVAAVYGPWFGLLVPVPLIIAAYAAVRDYKIRKRLLTDGVVDPKAPARLPSAGTAREIDPFPKAGGDSSR